MLRAIFNKVISLFSRPKDKAIPLRTRPNVSVGDKVGEVTIGYLGLKADPEKGLTQQTIDNIRRSQLDKHTDFKVGESYRLGEAIVTLHPNKASMLAAIARVDDIREAKHAKLTKRAEDIMLMTPIQLDELHLKDWLSKKKIKESIISRLMGRFTGNRYIPPRDLLDDPIAGSPKGRQDQVKSKFKEIMKDTVKEETVLIVKDKV